MRRAFAASFAMLVVLLAACGTSQPNCPEEDSCYADYNGTEWVIIQGQRAPTPTPAPVIIEVPGPTVEVPVIPEACMDAIEDLLQASTLDIKMIVSIYDAYLDFPDETLGQFGQRVEDILLNAEFGELPDNWSLDSCNINTTTGALSS